MDRAITVVATGIMLIASASTAAGQTLKGSPQAMAQQHRMAVQHDYTFLRTSAQIRRFVDNGYLVRMSGNQHYELAAVSHPYARPAVRLFVERLSAQYHAACGERLVVTSLTRPVLEQPRNASSLSVHPAGMAVDLRISRSTRCRQWLETTLLSLEKQGVLNAIRESRPPHYHVALYPSRYTQYVAQLTNRSASAQLASALPAAPAARAVPDAPGAAAGAPAATVTAAAETLSTEAAEGGEAESVLQYRVNRGDSLWSIARRHGTTVDTLRELNGLKGSAIIAGQVIAVPTTANGADGSES